MLPLIQFVALFRLTVPHKYKYNGTQQNSILHIDTLKEQKCHDKQICVSQGRSRLLLALLSTSLIGYKITWHNPFLFTPFLQTYTYQSSSKFFFTLWIAKMKCWNIASFHENTVSLETQFMHVNSVCSTNMDSTYM